VEEIENNLKNSNNVIVVGSFFVSAIIERGHTAAQLVETLRYKSEGQGFDSRWCHWNFSLT